jgi:eukaryotic-like serine/threonine-protein kinase
MKRDDDSTDSLIDVAAREYFQARERGEPIDRESFLQKYPGIADDISAFFSGGELLDDILAGTHARPAAKPKESPISVGDLDISGEIGRGGMGVVYRATQRGLDRAVAVKKIRLANASAPEDVERFRFEARAAAKLSHPNILPILTFVETPDEVLIVMPYFTGGDLRRRLETGPLAPRIAACIMIDIANGVAHAHAHGIIHRDIKPANIMLGDDGRAVIADFGLAKALETDSKLTHTGQIVGTPSYMAPEQASGDPNAIGLATDVYALGATLYALLVGRPPFHADTPFATIELVREHTPARPRLMNPKVPIDLEAIVMKCLSKTPAERYSDALEVAADLRRFLDGERVRAEQPSYWRRVRIAFGQSRNREIIQNWGGPLVSIGLLIFVAHLLLELSALVWAGWLAPRLAARAVIVLVMAKWLFDWRRGELGPLNPFERAIWAVWIGYLASLPFADLGLAILDRTRGEAVAIECLLAGVAFISTGGLSWGGCYAAGLAFFLLSVLGWFVSTGLDLAFGVVWLSTLIGLATRGARRE